MRSNLTAPVSTCSDQLEFRAIATLVAACFALAFGIPAQAQNVGARAVPSQQVVDCLVPGQIKHGANGVTMLGPRRNIRTSVANCQERGGEYVVATVVRAAPLVATPHRAEDMVIVRCLLPDQVRQLGTKASYVKVQRPVRIARWDCRARHGESVTLARYQNAEKVYATALAQAKPVAKKP